jgi:hypothetical protein
MKYVDFIDNNNQKVIGVSISREEYNTACFYANRLDSEKLYIAAGLHIIDTVVNGFGVSLQDKAELIQMIETHIKSAIINDNSDVS